MATYEDYYDHQNYDDEYSDDDIDINDDDMSETDEENDEGYDVSKEMDRGDPEDVAVDELMDKIEMYEKMADEAALRSEGECQMIVTDNAETSKVVKKSKVSRNDKNNGDCKGRCPTKGLKVTEPMYLEFDSKLRPIGRWRFKYGQHIGLCIRKLNIIWAWKDVSQGLKTTFWDETRALFHLPDNPEIKKVFLSSVAKRFRDFKSKLVRGHITFKRRLSNREMGNAPYQIWKHIKEPDWAIFKAAQMTPEAKAKREKAEKSAEKNTHHHHMGQRNYEDSQKIWIADGFYPSKEPNRGDDWYYSVHKRDKSGNRSIPNPETKEVVDKYIEWKEKESKGEFSPQWNKDALNMALGKPDHYGRVVEYGGINVGYKKAFEKSASKVECDWATLKAELREELREELNASMKDNLSTILQSMGVVIPSPSTSHLQPTQSPISPPQLESETSCHLLLKDPESGSLYDVASAMAYPPTENEKCHSMAMLPRHLKVKVLNVAEEFFGLPLPVPVPAFEIEVVESSIGTFVQWPIALIRFSCEKLSKNRRLKTMSPETIVSNDVPAFQLSGSRKSPPISDKAVAPLSKECLWLHTFVDSTQDADPFSITLKATLFNYSEDQAIWVSKEDIFQFLQRVRINISIIQVFIRSLQHDLDSTGKSSQIGWLCPELTSETRITANIQDANNYIFNALVASVAANNEFVLAPIFEQEHWMLLAIHVPSCVVYHFDSVSPKNGRQVKMKTIIRHFFTRYKLAGNPVSRKEPLWNNVKCAQQIGGLDCGFYIMKYMFGHKMP